MQSAIKKRNSLAVLITALLLLVLVSLALLSGYVIKIQDATPSKTVSFTVDLNGASKKNPSVQSKPSLEVDDTGKNWTKKESIPIFKAVYDENGEPTVVSAYGDSVIAPGTSNKYYFYINNDGNVPMTYRIETEKVIHMNIAGEDVRIPLEVRMNDHNGKYLIGSENRFTDINEVGTVTDRCSLSPNHYAKYTFEWQWPFERGEDDYDTFLGNLSAEAADTADATLIDVEVIISVIAEQSEGDVEGGLPQTGDMTNIGIWTGVCVCSVFLLVVVLFVRKRDENETEKQ